MEEKISLMPTIAIHTASPFKDLFPIKESVLNEIAEDMKQNGFDFAHPIIIWAGHKVTVVDGRKMRRFNMQSKLRAIGEV